MGHALLADAEAEYVSLTVWSTNNSNRLRCLFVRLPEGD